MLSLFQVYSTFLFIVINDFVLDEACTWFCKELKDKRLKIGINPVLRGDTYMLNDIHYHPGVQLPMAPKGSVISRMVENGHAVYISPPSQESVQPATRTEQHTGSSKFLAMVCQKIHDFHVLGNG